jgi:putative proteasome-type protease
MTYCLSINTHNGLVLATTSSVNLDNSIRPNMHRFIWPGNRFIVILSSGNGLIIDAVIDQVRQDIAQNKAINLRKVVNINDATDYIAGISASKQKVLTNRNKQNDTYDVNFLLAGQIGSQPMETLLIYTQGNFIHESNSSPFLQLGEIKYGKPILDRMVNRQMDLNNAARCALVSVDSTLQSNTSATKPIELLIYKNNSLETGIYQSFNQGNPLLKSISQSWNYGMTAALDKLPNFYWEN